MWDQLRATTGSGSGVYAYGFITCPTLHFSFLCLVSIFFLCYHNYTTSNRNTIPFFKKIFFSFEQYTDLSPNKSPKCCFFKNMYISQFFFHPPSFHTSISLARRQHIYQFVVWVCTLLFFHCSKRSFNPNGLFELNRLSRPSLGFGPDAVLSFGGKRFDPCRLE